MLFSNKITMYAQNNNGGFYALGFLLGSGGWGFFGGNRASKKFIRVLTKIIAINRWDFFIGVATIRRSSFWDLISIIL